VAQLREGESSCDVGGRKRESSRRRSSERRAERKSVERERVEEEAEAMRTKEVEA
jgi:hypothetical protein